MDHKVVWLNHYQALNVPVPVWERWCDRFVTVVVDKRCLQGTNNHKPRIVDMGGETAFLTWTGTADIMDHTVHVDEMLQFSPEEFPNHTNMKEMVFRELQSDYQVRDRFTEILKERASIAKATAMAASEEVQAKLRLQYDEDSGLPVQFVVNQKTPHQLYIIVGSELRFIQDVRKDDGTTILLGNISE